MIQLRSVLEVADNTGARKVSMIRRLGQMKKTAGVGDVIVVNVKESNTEATVKKGEVARAVGDTVEGDQIIVHTTKGFEVESFKRMSQVIREETCALKIFRSRAMTLVARMDWPPSSMKLSRRRTRSRPRTPAQTLAKTSSTALRLSARWARPAGAGQTASNRLAP